MHHIIEMEGKCAKSDIGVLCFSGLNSGLQLRTTFYFWRSQDQSVRHGQVRSFEIFAIEAGILIQFV